jgi:hypothetical protein
MVSVGRAIAARVGLRDEHEAGSHAGADTGVSSA